MILAYLEALDLGCYIEGSHLDSDGVWPWERSKLGFDGWEDIIDMKEGEIHRTIIDDTTPDGPIERTIIYKAPFAKCDREKDYEIAWEYFERLNNKWVL